MCEKDQAILSTLVGVIRKYGKNYCVPSQKTILRLLQEHHKLKISRRTLCYHLKDLEAQGYIKRFRRHRIGCVGKMEFRSTAYYVLAKVCNLAKKLVNMAKSLFWGSRVQNIAQYLSIQRDIKPEPSGKTVKPVDNSADCISAGEFYRQNPQIKRPSFC